ncbi:MAG TPA: DUF1801 domain-containing protein [Flavobacterium sp.]|uniref:DUF1801 domain-containing protein n=1 Tax=Flavobacterium sp. TaxID=239 RepID=UPI002CAB6659|nr:DUF1801 domain-containing protein [Flavobacterium sp.]HNP34047.1 DUF1801 domain-containing protein [Flavobacterium sp.]
MGKLAQIKTKETNNSVVDFINAVADEQKRKDSFVILEMMKKATGDEPKMWGTSLIGFGNLIYKSPKSGREVEWFKIGFSPRKANLTLYIMGFDGETRTSLLSKLGKHKTDGGCIYINKLEQVDLSVLEEMIKVGVKSKE